MPVKKVLFIGVIVSVFLLTGGCFWRGDGSSGSGTPYIPASAEQMSAIWGLQQTGIWVTGEGEVTVVPDIIQLSLGIQAEALTVAEAQKQAREAMDKVMSVLKAHKIAENDIQTQSFRIEPVRRYEPKTNMSEIIGYRVSNLVGVKIRNTADAGNIIDAVADAGGDLTVIQGINFSIDDPKPYYVQARQSAMEDAISKAEQLAKAAKVKLGKPVYINETTAYSPSPRPAFEAAAAKGIAPPTEISAGELKVQLRLEARFIIN